MGKNISIITMASCRGKSVARVGGCHVDTYVKWGCVDRWRTRAFFVKKTLTIIIWMCVCVQARLCLFVCACISVCLYLCSFLRINLSSENSDREAKDEQNLSKRGNRQAGSTFFVCVSERKGEKDRILWKKASKSRSWSNVPCSLRTNHFGKYSHREKKARYKP